MNKSQIRFCRTLVATWKVLHDPVLTNIYVRKWKRQRDIRLTIYGYVFREMYKEVYDNGYRVSDIGRLAEAIGRHQVPIGFSPSPFAPPFSYPCATFALPLG